MRAIDLIVNKVIFPMLMGVLTIVYIFISSDLLLLKSLLIVASAIMFRLGIVTMKNKLINLFVLFSFSYLIPIYYNVFSGKIITSYTHSYEQIFLLKYVYLYTLFFFVISVLVSSRFDISNIQFYTKDNFIVFYINITIILLLAFFANSGTSIFESGGYGLNEVNNAGGFALGEYASIFIFVAYKYSGESSFKKNVLLLVSALFVGRNLMFGSRNELLQVGLLIYALVYRQKGSVFGYLMVLVFGFYVNSLFSYIRTNPLILFQSSIQELVFLPFSLDSKDEKYISHQGDVVHSSSRLINFRDYLLDPEVVASSAVSFAASAFVPFKYLPPEANIAAYQKDVYPAGGGGSLFAYAYFWLGYFGVVIIGFYVGNLIRGFPRNINTKYSPYFIIVFTTFPRWFSYSPINLFKMAIYALIIFHFFVFLDTYLRKKVLS